MTTNYKKLELSSIPRSSKRVNSFADHSAAIFALEPGEAISWQKENKHAALNFRSCLWHGLDTAGVLKNYVTAMDKDNIVYVGRKEN